MKGAAFMVTGLIGILRSKTPRSEKGQDLAEYSLLIGLIAIVVIVSVALLGPNISEIFVMLAEAVEVGF